MAIIVESPNENYSVENHRNIKLFLAGSITGASDWQSYVISELKDYENLTIYNPRRKSFDINDKKMEEQQIVWEYNHLADSTIILFWFAKDVVSPIALYELGLWGNSNGDPIIVGVDKDYPRKNDVIIQTGLARPEIKILESLSECIDLIKDLMEDVTGQSDE
jgi:hypothetical protein